MKDADLSLFLLLMMPIVCRVTEFCATILVLGSKIEVWEHSGAAVI